jgi:hypothetical protein
MAPWSQGLEEIIPKIIPVVGRRDDTGNNSNFRLVGDDRQPYLAVVDPEAIIRLEGIQHPDEANDLQAS